MITARRGVAPTSLLILLFVHDVGAQPEAPGATETPPPTAPEAATPGGRADAPAAGTASVPATSAAPAATPVPSAPETGPPVVEPPAPLAAPSETSAAAPRGTATRGGIADDEGWRFEFHGYFRAPMRVGIGKRDQSAAGQGETTFHAPIVPDDQYLSWQHTNHSLRDWAELYFSIGKDIVKGTIGIEAYNFTNSAWNETGAQLGVAQGFVTISPRIGKKATLDVKAGSISDRYGEAGIYDAGEYDTYLFGRTHVAGETLTFGYEVAEGWKLTLSHGLGAKRPDPNVYNRSRFTLLHHAHAGIEWSETLQFGVHWLQAFAKEEDRAYDAANPNFGPSPGSGPLDDPPDGRLTVYGADLRLHEGMLGYLYAGFSRISARDAVVVAPAITVLHSHGGGEFNLGVTDNFLDGPNKASGGNGSVNTILGQYEFSVANFIYEQRDRESAFYGEGQDIRTKLYGMMSMVASDDPDMDGVRKLKYGIDAAFSALPWLVVAGRYDRVQPNSEIPEQSFGIVSPRVVFRSRWVTREEIVLQYSRYLYNQRSCSDPAAPTTCVQPAPSPPGPDGFGTGYENQEEGRRGAPMRSDGTPVPPDKQVITLAAAMYW